MSGHRHSRPRRDKARAERMRARIASAPDEFKALGAAFDWLRMELQHLERCGHADARTVRQPGAAGAIARDVMRDLIDRTEAIVKMSEETG